MGHNKLIIRGPSGSGKSTIAKRLFEQAEKKTCLIDQDHYRFIFNPAGGGSKTNIKPIRKMIKDNVITALNEGYDVILEGILNIKGYGKVINEIITLCPNNYHIFYLDVSFNESVKRHNTKPANKKAAFDEEDMREWYQSSQRLNHKSEKIIPETFSLQQSVDYILNETRFLKD